MKAGTGEREGSIPFGTFDGARGLESVEPSRSGSGLSGGEGEGEAAGAWVLRYLRPVPVSEDGC